MKEYKIGERITLEVKASDTCGDCFFGNICCDLDTRDFPCKVLSGSYNVIFKEVSNE